MALKGFANLCGFDIATTWGTAVDCAAGDGIGVLSQGMTPDITLIENAELNKTAFQREGTKGTERYQGPVGMYANAEEIHRWLAVLMGTAGVPTQLDAGESAYEHELIANESLEGVMSTIVFGQASEWVKEFTTAKLDSVEFASGPDRNLEATFQTIAQGRNDNTTSGTNTLTTWGTITRPTNSYKFTFNDLVVRINDQDGGALGGSDEVYVSELSLTLNNNLKVDRFTTQHAPLISEPKRNGHAIPNGSITFDEQDSTTVLALLADAQAKTVKKMDWTFTGPLCSTSYYYTITFEFAGLQFEPVDDAMDGAEIPDAVFPFRGCQAASNPTGFSHTDGCRIKIINTNGADPLVKTA